MTQKIPLDRIILYGNPDLEEMEKFVDTQAKQALFKAAVSKEYHEQVFAKWFKTTFKRLPVDVNVARSLFDGEISVDDFLMALHPTTVEKLVILNQGDEDGNQ